nr:ComGF family competence protein [Aquibacillus saliphilus]
MDFHKNEKGFTLISLLLATSIIFITLPILPYIINTIQHESYYEDLSVNQFFHFINEEFHIAISYSVEDSVITLQQENGETVTIDKYQSLVRRRVGNLGHEILLRNVSEFLIIPLTTGIKIAITTIEGVHYEKTFSFY